MAADEIEKLRADLDRSMRAYEYVCIERENKAKEIERLQRENEELRTAAEAWKSEAHVMYSKNGELRKAALKVLKESE